MEKTKNYAGGLTVLLSVIVIMSALSIVAFAFSRRWDFIGPGHIEQGENYTRVSMDTGAEGPLYAEGDRIILRVNGENLDITEQLSRDKAYIYRFTDGEGVEHIFLFGLHSSSVTDFGWGEFMRDASGNWMGGMASHYLDDNGEASPWFTEGKNAIQCPWPTA